MKEGTLHKLTVNVKDLSFRNTDILLDDVKVKGLRGFSVTGHINSRNVLALELLVERIDVNSDGVQLSVQEEPPEDE